jgi:signal transduction histidine kinase
MSVRLSRLALVPAGIGLGLVVEWSTYDPSLGRTLTGADFAVGCVLIGGGVAAWDRRSESRVGIVMLFASAMWFLGNLASPLLYLHRGPLVQLHLSYPTGRLRSRLVWAVVAAAYVDAAVEPLARNRLLTLGLACAVALTALRVFAGTSGLSRKAGKPALAAALAFAAVLALASSGRLLGWKTDLLVYDLVIASAAVVLVVDLLRGRWSDAIVTGLVVDLGTHAEAGTLRAKLARALGDPSLVVGYRLDGRAGFVDDAGRPVELPAAGSGRTATPLVDRGKAVAVLVHDEALLADPRLLDSVAAAARIAVANAALQAEARTRAGELETSRRRLVEAADTQRRRIEEELQARAGQRLANVGSLLAEARAQIGSTDRDAVAALEHEVLEARRELDELAFGVIPTALVSGGLMPALAQLARRSSTPVELRGTVGRLPRPIEAALYFVCSEAVANAAKHAAASRLEIAVVADAERVRATVSDDGVGGADLSAGSGLRGLADRVEALGGRLRVVSPAGGGTSVAAEVPTRHA